MKNVARNVVIALSLLVSAAAWAQDGSSQMLPRNWDAQLYADVGLHVTSVSSTTESASGTDFGLTFGGKATYRLSNTLSVGPLLNLSLVFDSNGTAVPITGAGAITLDKVLPVELTGGLGFTLYTGTGGGQTPVGLAILAQALYPIPGLPALGAHAQIVENILNDSVNLFQIAVGVAYKF